MSERSAIEWTDSTFNPWIGCTKVGPGCDHCYAEAMMDTRRHVARWGVGQARVRTSSANWKQPVSWNARPFWECQECGWRGDKLAIAVTVGCCPQCACFGVHPARRRVFCASLADVFDNDVDPQWRADLFHLIASTPNLDWLVLTKRIGNAWPMMAATLVDSSAFLDHLWLGATVVNQAEADRDVPKLLAIPARRRFLSCEPLLGLIRLDRIHESGVGEGGSHWDSWESCLNGRRFDIWSDGEVDGFPKIDWVIAGGESGHGARPMHPDWVRSLRDQCAAARVPFLFKQWGEFASVSEVAGDGAHFKFPDGATVRRVGKKKAGRTLDGSTHDEFPRAA